MTNQISELDWDSAFFGFKTGKIQLSASESIELEKVRKLSLEGGFKLVYCFVDPSSPANQAFINDSGIKLVDEKVTFYKLVDLNLQFKNPSIGVYKKTVVVPELYELAHESGTFSRFRTDGNFPKSTFEKFYDIWIENSVTKKNADIVFTFNESDKILGFVSLKKGINDATIGLIAVDKHMRGQNIGSHLIQTCELQLQQWGVSQLRVVTQKANLGAMHFYEQNGFVIENIVNIYHLWNI